jgi:hypothetical protein
LLLLLFTSTDSLGQKNDTLYFLNGDRISGEIKQYKYGFLNYKTYGVSTVKVKYDKISSFYSNKNFDILLVSGSRRFGSFDTSSMKQFVKIIITNDTILTPLIEIVEITPIKKRFWSRFSGSADLGFSYTKANSLGQLTLNGDIKHTQRNHISSLKFSSINSIQNQQGSTRTRKNDLSGNYYYRIKNNWFGIAMLSAEQNTELGLNLRAQGGGGIANELIHTNRHNLVTSIGVVLNKEWSATEEGTRSNVDAYASANYRLFRFEDPEIDITNTAIAYPSLTVPGRWRFNYDIKLKFEIINDMYFSVSFYTSYDSKPPSETSENIDYSLTASFGYTF